MVFKEITNFKEIYKTEEGHLFGVLLMEGHSYLEIQNYDKASKIFEKLLKKSAKNITRHIIFNL